VQKVFYLPEAHTDFILAVVGEELGVAGICGLLALYGMIGYAGLRTARTAATRHLQLLAAGLTAMILCQALLNICAVLGIAPVTGVPLPFISSGGTSLIVLLATMGLLLNIAARSTSHLALAPEPPGERADARGSRGAPSGDRGGRHGGARGARAGGSRTADGRGR
jgi:cell division protein FtsW